MGHPMRAVLALLPPSSVRGSLPRGPGAAPLLPPPPRLSLSLSERPLVLLSCLARETPERPGCSLSPSPDQKACDKGAGMPRLASPPFAPAASAERPGEDKEVVEAC